MAASAVLIVASFSGLGVHVLGFQEWSRSQGQPSAEQKLPDTWASATELRLSGAGGHAGDVARRVMKQDHTGDRAETGDAGRVVPADGAATGGAPAPAADDGGEGVVNVAASRSGDHAGRGWVVADRDGGGGPVARAAVDSDGDGLSDGREQNIGTDPQRGDTDGDGVPDAFEVDNGLDPVAAGDAAADPDVDGVNNRNEYLVAFDPQNADSNEDGVSDGDSDSDGDGLPNAIEQKLRLNPSTPVTRGAASAPVPVVASVGSSTDDASRAPVTQSASKPVVSESNSKPAVSGPAAGAVNDGALDSDGDGFTNADEVAAGTDPADASSHPPAPAGSQQPTEESAPPPDTPVEPAPLADPVPPADPAPADPAPADPALGATAPANPAPTPPAPATPADPPAPVEPAPAG